VNRGALELAGGHEVSHQQLRLLRVDAMSLQHRCDARVVRTQVTTGEVCAEEARCEASKEALACT
jgi:hypothetical protein